jgi:GT2 family glycosyltransferase
MKNIINPPVSISKPIDIDIIIISHAKNETFRQLTIQTIETLLSSESKEDICFHIYVIESETSISDYEYPNTFTIRPSVPFGYHRYLNIGVKLGKSQYIGLANNDLVFHNGWATNILNEMSLDSDLASVGTWCPIFHTKYKISKEPVVQAGYQNGIHITGWFLFLTRKLYDSMEGLDEHFIFWYCDDDYGRTLEKMGIKHALITSSEVKHMTSLTIVELPKDHYDKMTKLPNLYYDYKWNHRSYLIYLLKRLLFSFKQTWNRKISKYRG